MTALLKCVVWDLDNTLWRGTLAEGDDVHLMPAARDFVERLEHAGIVQSVASKNDPDHAAAMLTEFGFGDRFVYPQMSWSAKSAAVRRIAELLNIATDTVVLLDDSPFERAEVSSGVPGVRCYSLPDFMAISDSELVLPRQLTAEALKRPSAYRQEASRKAAEAEFDGPPADFLASLDMVLSLRVARPDDLDRASELTKRTNQLNTTGRIFTPADLAEYAASPTRDVLIAELRDRFGDYGRVGLCLLHRTAKFWLIQLLLMSCRVMGRNAGNAFVGALGGLAATHNVSLRALYRPTGRNRQMRITYGFLGFAPLSVDGDVVMLEHSQPGEIRTPHYATVLLDPDLAASHRGPLIAQPPLSLTKPPGAAT